MPAQAALRALGAGPAAAAGRGAGRRAALARPRAAGERWCWATPAAPPCPLALSGFWAAYRRRQDRLRARQPAPDGHAPALLARGYYATRARYLLNQAELRYKSVPHLQRLLLEVAEADRLPAALAADDDGADRAAVPLAALLRYALRLAGLKLHDKLYKQYLRRTEVWGISFLHAGWRGADLARRITPPVPPGHFWADPFLWRRDGRTYCFLEDYDYQRALGHIAVLELHQDRATELGACLVEPFHLSFPYLFEYQGQLYMCPESSQSGQIRVYRSSAFPLGWELAAVLMEGVSAADTMLFEQDGRWWMLTNLDLSHGGDHCSELQLFWAPTPLGGDWTPHPCNPIAVDPVGARNGGLLREQGRLYRVGQRQGYCNYGEGLIVHEVLRLSPTEYAEREVSRIDPDFAPGISGTHHLSSLGGITVLDHKSWRRAGQAGDQHE
ncbi:hypothetical protein HUX88_25870 [Duganella sp. BJB1802]|uniref:glucosamine inositolphosphorylceramide transferase family protein n=1 Tax=Duganella sp. BJB1802 TaxID=2744575 RepID=UPI0015946E09|nr:hypothetical protein [Duganella sp. BJB1802]NVD73931.1 hypothetical protein [Duganella sp. BJB1802]